MQTAIIILAILLALSILANIFLAIRALVQKNYLSLMDARMREIEIRLSPKNSKGFNHEQKTDSTKKLD